MGGVPDARDAQAVGSYWSHPVKRPARARVDERGLLLAQGAQEREAASGWPGVEAVVLARALAALRDELERSEQGRLLMGETRGASRGNRRPSAPFLALVWR